MAVYIILTIIVCLFIYFLTNKNQDARFVINSRKINMNKKKIAFIITFLILAFFSAIRYNCGCDYLSYMKHISSIQAGSINYMEIGFKTAVILLSNITMDPKFVISVFGILTVFFYTKAIWDQSDNVLFSVFIFLTWGYYFMTFNSIRNYFALALVLYSIKYLNKNNNLIFIIIVIIASLFHKSALVCIPIYFFAKGKFNKKHALIFIAITIALLLFKEQLRPIVFTIYPTYENSVYDIERISFLNIIKAIAIIIFGLMYYDKFKNDNLTRLYFNLNVFALMFYIGMYWTPSISRIGFYMNATSILLIPRIVKHVSTNDNRKMYNFVIVSASIVLFLLLLVKFASPTTRLLPYDTWLFK